MNAIKNISPASYIQNGCASIIKFRIRIRGKLLFLFKCPWLLKKNIDTNKQNMVTYVDNRVLVQQKMSTCICQKTNSENNQTHGHIKNDNIMTYSQINSRRQYFIILFSTKLYTWSHAIFMKLSKTL